MLSGCDLVAFVSTAEPARARAFYGETLGLALLEQSSFASAFAAGSATLRVTTVERVIPVPYTVLGWTVRDIAATVGRLAGAGVECLRFDGLDQDSGGVWNAPGGARIAWFHDPDGNILSVSQVASGGSAPPLSAVD